MVLATLWLAASALPFPLDCEGPVAYSLVDADGDGAGDPASAQLAPDCASVPAGSLPADDCDDSSPAVGPGAVEACNGADDDCDGQLDEDACHCPEVVPAATSTWQVCLDEVDAFGAAVACAGDGWHLASIDAAATQDELIAVLAPHARDFFIGLNDLEVEGTFVWEDGTPVTYTNWDVGQPNDLFGQDCTDVEPSGRWRDEACLDVQAYVCELEGRCPERWWFDDRDGDGFGDPGSGVPACVAGEGQVLNGLDCDDGDAGLVLCDDELADTAAGGGLPWDPGGDGIQPPPEPDFGFGLGCATGGGPASWGSLLAVSLLLVAACGGDDPASESCEAPEPALFGHPSAATGLDDGACGPECGCGGFVAPTYDDEDVAAMRAWTLLEPPDLPSSDPYDDPASVPDRAGVCAVVVVDEAARTYRLETFAEAAAAEAAGAIVTHDAACGLCSSLEDLAAYVANPDLTEPVRACGVSGTFGSAEEHRACLQDLGFTAPCAEIWRYNTRNTQAACLDVCVALLEAPYHEADGALNACLQCDEEQSGPVFKAVAGRTRRNSGLASALCRPCDTVFPVVHDW